MRLIDLGTVTPEFSVIAETSVLKHHPRTGDTLLFYSRDRPCISAGRYSDISTTIDTEAAKKDNIPIIRRISGGSSIFYDKGQLTYSLIISRSEFTEDKKKMFKTICESIATSLISMGMDATYKPTNDVLVSNRKISGSSQYRNATTVMQHGSLLLDADLELMSRYVLTGKGYDGLTTMKEVLEHIPSRDDVIKTLAKGFSDILGVSFEYCHLDESEKATIRNMCDDVDADE